MLLQPATKSRFEIGLILKGQESKGILEVIPTTNAMCPHKINITEKEDITTDVLNWLKSAYDRAG